MLSWYLKRYYGRKNEVKHPRMNSGSSGSAVVPKGLTNKELAKFTDQINALCDKYSKK